MRPSGTKYYDKVNNYGNSLKRERQEDIQAILEIASAYPIGTLQLMHALLLPHSKAADLINRLVELGLLESEGIENYLKSLQKDEDG
jgi:predicted transcriptional regulator